MSGFPHIVQLPQAASEDQIPLWNAHHCSGNLDRAKEAILDCLLLSGCRYVLKGMSGLSAFSKVINPDLEAYRIPAFKHGWFPDTFIPIYRSPNKSVQLLLNVLQEGNLEDGVYENYTGDTTLQRLARRAVRKLARISGRYRSDSGLASRTAGTGG